MNMAGRTMQSLFNRRVAWTVLGVLAIVMIAATVNVVGIRVVGNIDGWRRWMQSMSPYFLAWRVCLYGATAYGWGWMHKRIKRRERNPDTAARLRRTEVAAVLAVLVLEVAVLLQAP